MKQLFVALFFLVSVVAHAETLARVRMRVRLPFEMDNPSAVVLPVGTVVTVLWPEDGKLMIRYRRVEGLVPSRAIDYVVGAHPADVRQYRPEPALKESDSATAPVERTANTYHPQASSLAAGPEAMFESLPVKKILGGFVLVVVVLFFATREKKEDNGGRLLRRQMGGS